jgi:undecaprenyl-diphosphatase
MSLLDAIILSIVEGLTEFLPVSSTGHMIIVSSLLGIAQEPFTKTFTVVIQLGAIMSVVVLYWKRFFKSIHFYLKLLVAFLPAVVGGLLLGDMIDALLERVDVVGYALIAGGVFFLFVDNLFKSTEENGRDEVSYPSALKIGLFQLLALMPGVSRSASTIIGGLFQKLDKKTAAEFSFFLAVPTMFAATVYKLFGFYEEGYRFADNEVIILIAGNVVAFIVALLAIRTFIKFLTNHGFRVFGWYRIVVGVVILTLYYAHVGLSVL